MPKLKTPNSIAKRFKVKKATSSRGKKFEHVKTGQNHFNGKESGTITRRKRGKKDAHKSNYKNLKTFLTNK